MIYLPALGLSYKHRPDPSKQACGSIFIVTAVPSGTSGQLAEKQLVGGNPAELARQRLSKAQLYIKKIHSIEKEKGRKQEKEQG